MNKTVADLIIYAVANAYGWKLIGTSVWQNAEKESLSMVDTQVMLEAICLIQSSCERLYHNEGDQEKKNELAFCISEAEVLKKMVEGSNCLELTEDERKAIKAVRRYSLVDVFWSDKTLKAIDGVLRKLPVMKHEENL